MLPWCRAHGVTFQAYTPLDQGRLAKARAVRDVAERHGVTASAVALARTVREPGTSAVAKTSRPARVQELAAALTQYAQRNITCASAMLRDAAAAQRPH